MGTWLQTIIFFQFLLSALVSQTACDSNLQVQTSEIPSTVEPHSDEVPDVAGAPKFTVDECVDPILEDIPTNVTLTLCNGDFARGKLDVTSLIPSNCSADGVVGCVTTEAFKSADMGNVIASNIRSATTIAGVLGTYAGMNPDCSSDGELGCVTVPAYKAAKMSNVVAANVKDGVTIAGVLGTYPSLSTPLAGASGMNDLTSLDAAVPAGGYEFFDSTGARHTGAVADAGTIMPGASNQTFNASLYRQFTVTGDADLHANNIRNAVEIFGITGNLQQETHSNCTANAQTGCVTTAGYKSADLTNLSAGNIKFGITIAGQVGDYPSVTYPLTGNTVTTDLPSLAASVAAGNYEWFKSDGTLVSGTIADAGNVTPSPSSQTFNSFVYRQFTVNGDADLVASNIKNAIDIFGVTGNATIESHTSCATDGEVGCVVVGPAFKAADMSHVTAGNIKSGVIIAGQTGDYPSATYRLNGADPTTDLPAFASTSGGSSYEWFQSDGTRLTGSILADQSVTASTSDQTLNSGLYRSVTVTGDADLVAAKVKNGVTLFGVTGDYPSATNTLNGADTTPDLDLATFDAKVKSASAFEWFDANGTRYTNTGDADITAANIMSGVSIFGTAGSLNANTDCQHGTQAACIADNACSWNAGACSINPWNIRKGVTLVGKSGQLNERCRNTINPSLQDTDAMPPVLGTTAGSVNDWWDTIDDYNNGGAYPSQVPSSWTNTVCDRNNWRDVTPDGACNANGDDCMAKDLISNLIWTELNPVASSAPGPGVTVDRTWNQSVQYCDSLVYGGRSDWRLPTQKELMTAYAHGIRDMLLQYGAFIADPAGLGDYVWASTVYSIATTSAWRMSIATGEMAFGGGGYYRSYLCVAE